MIRGRQRATALDVLAGRHARTEGRREGERHVALKCGDKHASAESRWRQLCKLLKKDASISYVTAKNNRVRHDDERRPPARRVEVPFLELRPVALMSRALG